jgi:hypothetical protein
MATSYGSENNQLYNNILTNTKNLYPANCFFTAEETHFYDDTQGIFISFPHQPALEELFSNAIYWDGSAIRWILQVKPQIFSNLPNHDELASLFDNIYSLSVFFGRELNLLQNTREKFIYNLKLFIYEVISQEDKSIMNTLCCSYVTKLNLDISTLYSKYVDFLKNNTLTITAIMLAAPSSIGLSIAAAMGSINPICYVYLAPGACLPFVLSPLFIYSYVKYHRIIKKINEFEQSKSDNSV